MLFWSEGRKKKTAKSVVRDWEKKRVTNIVNDIAKIIPQHAPFLHDIAMSSLSNLINKNLVFLTGEPERVSKDLYSIVDTVKVNIGPGIPFIGKQFKISINYNLKIDVKEKRIIEAKPDIGSLKIDFA